MNLKSIAECERRNLEKMKRYRLPFGYKKIGILVIMISIIGIIINKTSIDDNLFAQVGKYGILLGLVLISLSKEKIEDELVISLKMQAYTFAFVISVILTLTNPLFTYIASIIANKPMDIFKGMGDWQILWLLLSIQLFYFEFLKRVSR